MRWVIFGAGGLGREVLSFIHEIRDVVAFVDVRRGDPIGHIEVIGQTDFFERARSLVPLGDVLGIIAVGNPRIRESIAEAIKDTGVSFPPTLLGYIGSRVSVDAGVVVCPGAVLTTDINIGKHVYINIGCTIGHDVEIGEYCKINPGSNISGHVKIGRCCLIGVGATILQGLTLGDYVTVGAGAVVTKDVPDNTTVIGVPARPMR